MHIITHKKTRHTPRLGRVEIARFQLEHPQSLQILVQWIAPQLSQSLPPSHLRHNNTYAKKIPVKIRNQKTRSNSKVPLISCALTARQRSQPQKGHTASSHGNRHRSASSQAQERHNQNKLSKAKQQAKDNNPSFGKYEKQPIESIYFLYLRTHWSNLLLFVWQWTF